MEYSDGVPPRFFLFRNEITKREILPLIEGKRKFKINEIHDTWLVSWEMEVTLGCN